MSTTTTTPLLDDGTIERFRRDGFVVVGGLFSSASSTGTASR